MAKLRLPFGFLIHWGEPVRDMQLVSASAYRFRGLDQTWMEHRYRSSIDRWYGIERSSSGWLLMLMRTHRLSDETVPSRDPVGSALASQKKGDGRG